MPLVFAAIAPHGFSLIPDLSDDAEGAVATRAAMEELGPRCAASRPDVLVIAGPHGVRVNGTVCLADVSRGAGILRWNGRSVEMNVPVDGPLTDAIAAEAQTSGVPIAMAGYAGSRRSQSVLPIDWGVITPLWFLGHGRNAIGHGDVLADPPDEDLGPPVVIVTPSRSLPRSAFVEFGRAIGRATASTERRVAFIASCDWAHTHRDDGPYGFHRSAAVVDAEIVAAIRDGDLIRLLDLDEQAAEEAAIDGLPQLLILAGVLDDLPFAHDLLSYEAPTYYGMIVAAYAPMAA